LPSTQLRDKLAENNNGVIISKFLVIAKKHDTMKRDNALVD